MMTLGLTFGRSLRRLPGRGGARVWVLACGLALASSGCGKKSEPGGAAPPAPATQAVSAAAAPAAQPDLDAITRQLRRWIVRNQRPPRDFEDFAATANFPIPPPPEGKKYAINSQMHVVLVNR
jgi:hypothetical protein